MKKAEMALDAGSKNKRSSENQINFLSNLKYLIVISKAYLKNYQLDDEITKTAIKTANTVFNECKDWEGLFKQYRSPFKKEEINTKDHFFYQRAILMAVMTKSLCIGNFMGNNRKKSLKKTTDYLCTALNIAVNDEDFENHGLLPQREETPQNKQGIHGMKDNRRYKRVEYLTSVNLTMDKKKYITELWDLSLGGAFISADSIPHMETGKQVSLTIPFVNKPSEIEIKGTVQRLFGEGAGVEFF